MLVKVEVTQDDIEQGNKNSCFYCPIALAASRATGTIVAVGTFEHVIGGKFIGVGVNLAWIYCNPDGMNVERWAKLPQVANDFVKRFDESGVGEPISFDLEFLEEVSQ